MNTSVEKARRLILSSVQLNKYLLETKSKNVYQQVPVNSPWLEKETMNCELSTSTIVKFCQERSFPITIIAKKKTARAETDKQILITLQLIVMFRINAIISEF